MSRRRASLRPGTLRPAPAARGPRPGPDALQRTARSPSAGRRNACPLRAPTGTSRRRSTPTALLTHGHVDHAEGARTLAAACGVGVRALDPEHRLGDEGLADGDVVNLGAWTIEVVATPGHSGDSVCLVVPHDGSVLTGDTVLGRGTSLVAWPDGRLADYLDSLRRLREVVDSSGVVRLLPGHGPVLADPGGVLDAYLDHRRARLAEVQEVMASGITEPAAIVEVVYADVPRAVWPAAELTVRAQLDYLQQQ